jgi:hypothetical protein
VENSTLRCPAACLRSRPTALRASLFTTTGLSVRLPKFTGGSRFGVPLCHRSNLCFFLPLPLGRFKEMLAWRVDTDGYYSSPTAKYLEYYNPDPSRTLQAETAALKTALKIGQLTQRIVILPVFGCHGCSVTGAGGTKAGCSGMAGQVA